MAELGQTRDPRLLTPGDPGAIDENVVAIRGRGEAMENAGNGLKRIDGGAWIGAAGNAFREAFSYEPGRWFAAGDAFEATATALSDYAGTLRWAQGQAADAAWLWDQGEYATQRPRMRTTGRSPTRRREAARESRPWYHRSPIPARACGRPPAKSSTGLASSSPTRVTVPRQ